MTKWIIALLATGALLGGCSKDDKAGDSAKGGDSVGVAECDDYLKKVEVCMEKTPAAKTAMEASTKQMRDAWKSAAAQGGAAKDALKTGCKAAIDGLASNPMCK